MSDKKIKKTLIGEVIKLSSTHTIKVRVETKKTHPKYGKVIKSHKNYLVHYTGSDLKVGDAIKIVEDRPVSKSKSWHFLSLATDK